MATKNKKLDVKILTHTIQPIETIWDIWQYSKTYTDHIPQPDRSVKEKLFQDLINMDVPILENVSFTFLLENMSISFREQIVRHRIGTKVGDNIGVDIVPDFNSSSYWSQSMRIKDMSSFADENDFRIPDSIGGDGQAYGVYVDAMVEIQNVYSKLISLGIPMEDAREVLPLGTQHRMTWTVNLKSLIHILRKRSCWILQAGYWTDFTSQVVDQLMKISPVFRILGHPPCVKDGKCVDCKYKHENERRVDGRDNLPTCPIYHRLGEDGEIDLGAIVANVQPEFEEILEKWMGTLGRHAGEQEIDNFTNDFYRRFQLYKQIWR